MREARRARAQTQERVWEARGSHGRTGFWEAGGRKLVEVSDLQVFKLAEEWLPPQQTADSRRPAEASAVLWGGRNGGPQGGGDSPGAGGERPEGAMGTGIALSTRQKETRHMAGRSGKAGRDNRWIR